MQRDGMADPSARQRAIDRVMARLSGVFTGPSCLGPAGTMGLFLPADMALGPPGALLQGAEFAALHPLPGGSLVLALPAEWRAAALERGWAEPHPQAGYGLLPASAILVYAPRDAAEAEQVARLIEAGWLHARGEGE